MTTYYFFPEHTIHVITVGCELVFMVMVLEDLLKRWLWLKIVDNNNRKHKLWSVVTGYRDIVYKQSV